MLNRIRKNIQSFLYVFCVFCFKVLLTYLSIDSWKLLSLKNDKIGLMFYYQNFTCFSSANHIDRDDMKKNSYFSGSNHVDIFLTSELKKQQLTFTLCNLIFFTVFGGISATMTLNFAFIHSIFSREICIKVLKTIKQNFNDHH